MTDVVLRGGCNCGRVTFEIRGEPDRVGLCHCLTCRKETGSPFMAFADFGADQMTVTGETASWTSRTDRRHFCPVCGSTLFAISDASGRTEAEVRIGSLDNAPSGMVPDYEVWTARREHWLVPVAGAGQHREGRS